MTDQMVMSMGDDQLHDWLVARTPPGYLLWGSERNQAACMTHFVYVTENPAGLYWTDG